MYIIITLILLHMSLFCFQVPVYVIEYENRHFRPDVHVRFHSSDQKSDQIRTYLWPALREGISGPCVQKGVVITWVFCERRFYETNKNDIIKFYWHVSDRWIIPAIFYILCNNKQFYTWFHIERISRFYSWISYLMSLSWSNLVVVVKQLLVSVRLKIAANNDILFFKL